jgi:hypothetical protein
VIAGAYSRSYVQGSTAWERLQLKEESNFCNDYAFSFQQRHPTEFTGDAFGGCAPLMRQTFGRPMPSIFQAIAANPKAVAAFAVWDARLAPGGLQVSLLGADAFGADPGFRPVTQNSTYALLLSLLIVAAFVGALLIARRDGRLALGRASPRRLWVTLTLASIALATLLVIVTTRPWSDYIYALSISAFIAVAWTVSVLARRFGVTWLLAPVALVLAAVLIVVVPSAYPAAPRPLYDAVRNLQVVRQQLRVPGSVLVSGTNANLECNYLAYSKADSCTGLSWPTLSAALSGENSLADVLDTTGATVLYADESVLSDPVMARFVAAPRAVGWRRLASGNGAEGPWFILVRAGRKLSSPSAIKRPAKTAATTARMPSIGSRLPLVARYGLVLAIGDRPH